MIPQSKGITLPAGTLPESVVAQLDSVRTDVTNELGLKAIDKRYIIIEALRAALEDKAMRKIIVTEVSNRYYGR